MLDFEDYIFSENVVDYDKDINQKNILIKQIKKILREDEVDQQNFIRMINGIILLRNTFSREAVVEFFNDKFNPGELKDIGQLLYEVLVSTKEGLIHDHKRYTDAVFELMKSKGISKKINEAFETYKQECR